MTEIKVGDQVTWREREFTVRMVFPWSLLLRDGQGNKYFVDKFAVQ